MMTLPEAPAHVTDQPPAIRSRITTDLQVSQIHWWDRTVTVLPPPANGRFASLRAAWQAVRAAQRCDVFVSANVRNALAIGLMKRLTFRARPALIMTEMRLDDPRADLAWRAKVALQRYAYRAVDAMCVSARREADVYVSRLGVPARRVRFVPWHTNVLEPKMCRGTGSYVFAAGRTSRDWRTLAEAVRPLDVPVTVVCTRRDAELVGFPPHVRVLCDIPYRQYRELLEGARAVAIPLEPHVYSSGQVVILEAMALGKPVVTTAVLGSEDYVIDGVDGLLVPPGDPLALRQALVDVASSSARAEQLGRAALEKVRRTHLLDQYVRRIVGLAEELNEGLRGPR
jgi:hypothetical protein